jgi:hypothetical protein
MRQYRTVLLYQDQANMEDNSGKSLDNADLALTHASALNTPFASPDGRA